ncbi:MAG: aminotransferase class I/II-fold pyridoxal phosphate-dependent enzyme [Phycisphaeraceae bacterium]
MFDPSRFIADRARAVDASGIRKVFDLAANLENPINLSIGQPDFDVPDPIKDAAVEAIRSGFNKYTQTQGTKALLDRIREDVQRRYAACNDEAGVLVTSGVSGALVLLMLACVQPGDEVLIPDPYFVMYKHLVRLTGGTPVFVDTYPDFQLRPERIEPLITQRTKMLLFNSPSNPTGTVADAELCRQVAELADRYGLLLVSDEIYDTFCYEKISLPGRPDEQVAPSPLDYSPNVLLLKGFSKSYAMTGWRLGYAVGPAPVIAEMTKLQQYSFVCAPSMTQAAGLTALDIDMSEQVEAYRRKRDRLIERLAPHYELAHPGGAFYAFPKVPEHLGLSGTEFVKRAIENNVLIIPGNVFSERDTHFRISYACDDDTLERGLDVLVKLAKSDSV